MPAYARTLTEARGYDKNPATLILVEVERQHGQAAVYPMTREFGLEQIFESVPGQTLQQRHALN